MIIIITLSLIFNPSTKLFMYGLVNKNCAAKMRICHFPLSSYFEKTPRPSFFSISFVLMFFLAATALFLTYCTKNIPVKSLWDENVQFYTDCSVVDPAWYQCRSGSPRRTSKLKEKPPTPKRGLLTLQNNTFRHFFCG
jgi:hypothetical protein